MEELASVENDAGIREGLDGRYSFNYQNCPVGLALRDMFNNASVDYILPGTIPDVSVSGRWEDAPLETIAADVCRQAGLSFNVFNGVYRILSPDGTSKGALFLQNADSERVEKIAAVISAKEANVVNLDGYVVVSDDFENLCQILRVYRQFQTCQNRRYYVELFFIKHSLEDYLNLEAKLSFKGFDLFSGVSSIADVLSCYASASGAVTNSNLVDVQTLYVSEGNLSTFQVGTTLTRETKQVSEQGYASTSGFEKFSDGVNIGLKVSKIAPNKYNMLINLESSKYRSNVSSLDVVPPNDTAKVENNSLIMDNGKLYLLAELKQVSTGSGFGVVSFNGSNTSSVLSIWGRVRYID